MTLDSRKGIIYFVIRIIKEKRGKLHRKLLEGCTTIICEKMNASNNVVR
jgi:hypothetical protein